MPSQFASFALAVSLGFVSSLPAAAQPINNSSGQIYVVREGETLRHIAGRFYEDQLAFPTIIEATNELHDNGSGLLMIENEFDVRPGQRVWIPLVVTHRHTSSCSIAMCT